MESITPEQDAVIKEGIRESNKSLQLFLIVLVIGLPLMNLPQRFAAVEQLVFSVLFTFLILLGTGTLVTSRKGIWVGAVFGACVVLSHWLQYGVASEMLAVAEVGVSFLFFSIFLLILLKRVFDKGPVDAFKIEGAVVAFLVIAVIMGNLYSGIELLSPGSFQVSSNPMPSDLNTIRKNLIYYSFTTITTLGLGDVLAVNPIARTFTMLEACVGVLFPNILIARLVSLEIINSQNKGN